MQFLVVGQWQGSASARAMRLADGARAIGADLPKHATSTLRVPEGAGDRLDTAIARYTAVRAVAESVAEEVAVAVEPVLIIGGDGASVIGASVACDTHTAIVRIAGSSGFRATSRAQPVAAEASALRLLIDRPADLFPELPVLTSTRVVLVGVRGLERSEQVSLNEAGVTTLTADEATPEAVDAAVSATGATRVLLHVDLDALDPAEISGILEPVPFGFDGPGLVQRIAAAANGREIAAAAITGFAPAGEDQAVDDLGLILRVVGAVAGAARSA